MKTDKRDIPVIKTFFFDNKYFMYDARSNCLFEITKELFVEMSYLKQYGVNNYLTSARNTKQFDDIVALINKGVISKPYIEKIEHPETDYIDSLIDRCVNDITLQVTRMCNFNCRYCAFANNNKIVRNHEKASMTWDVAKKSIDFLYEHSLDSTVVTIGFYGGEPMVNFDLIKAVVEYSKTLFFSKKIIYRMTINGSILTDSMLDFLVENNFIIVISLDGPENIQNKHRKFNESGDGTFNLVYHNVNKIRNKYEKYFCENVSFMSVVFDDEDPEAVLKFYKSIDIPEHYVKLMSADLSGVDYTYNNIYGYNDDNPLDETFYDRMIKVYNKKNSLPNRWHHPGQCIPSIKSLFVNVYGEFYPCEKLIENKGLSIGNIKSGLNIKKIIDFMNIGKLTETECKNCWAMRFCEICIAQCFDIESGYITKEAKHSSCIKQEQKVLYFFKKFLKAKYNAMNER